MTSPTLSPSREMTATPPKPGEAGGPNESQRKAILIASGVGIVVLLALGIAAAVFLVRHPAEAASVRDVFIIFMGLEFMLIGVALVILIVQLAVLTNMLQHEIKPILESTNETVNTVRGTTLFLSENLVEPVIKLNSVLAALSQLVETLSVFGRFGRKK